MDRTRKLRRVAAASVLVLALPYLFAGREPEQLDDSVRAARGARFIQPDRHPEFDSLCLSTLSIRGSRKAVLSTLRTVPFGEYAAGFEEIGRAGIPVLLIWGQHDRVVPFENHEKVRALLSARHFVAVEGAAHFPNFEQPDLVNAEIVAFLQQFEN